MARVETHWVKAEKFQDDGITRYEWWCDEEGCTYHAIQYEGEEFEVITPGSPLVTHIPQNYRPSKTEVK